LREFIETIYDMFMSSPQQLMKTAYSLHKKAIEMIYIFCLKGGMIYI